MTLPFLSTATTKRRTHGDFVHNAVWTDQWERAFSGNKDKKSLHPSSQILPEGWAPPHVALIPPSKYHLFPARDTGRFTVNVAQWRRDQIGARQDWNRDYANYQRTLKPDSPVTALELAGQMPLAAVWFEAMELNNRWVLGIPNPRTGRMEPRPAWVDEKIPGTDITPWETLTRAEFYEGAIGEVSAADRAKYGNPDDDDSEDFAFVGGAPVVNDDIVARMAGQLDRQDLQDQHQPESQPMRGSTRGKGGQFTKRG